MLQELGKLREKLGMPEIGDDFQSCTESEVPTLFIVSPETFTETPSWTSVYKKLNEGEKSVGSITEDVHESISEIVSESIKTDE